MNLRAGVGVVVEFGGVQPDEFDRVHPDRAGGVEPFGAGQQRRRVARGQEQPAQRERGKGVSGVGSGDYGDAHAATLPQRRATTLGAMTGSTSSAVDTTANARVVETFLYALQDEDFDTADATLADNIVWQNVGYTTMRGRQRIIKLFRRGAGPRSASR